LEVQALLLLRVSVENSRTHSINHQPGEEKKERYYLVVKGACHFTGI
jgi:hypothetical protein